MIELIEKYKYKIRKIILLLVILFSVLLIFVYYKNLTIEKIEKLNTNNENKIIYFNSDKIEVLSEYSWLNYLDFDISLGSKFETCERIAIFNLQNWAGIGHIINTQLSVMTCAYFTNRSFFINDDNWNYGKWSNYFSPEGFVNINNNKNIYQILYNNNNKCEIKDVERIPNLNDMYRNENVNINVSHIIIQDWWEPLSVIFNYNKQYENNNKTGIWKYEKIFKLRSNFLNNFWILKPQLRNIVKKRIHELNNNYISIHIRRGDKIKELKNNEFTPLSKFYDSIQKIFNDKKYPHLNEKNTSILLVSDNINIIYELKKDKPNWNFVTTWPLNSSLYIKDEFEQGLINRVPPVVRQAYGIGFIIELELMKLSEFVICTHSSNICRLIAQLKGWNDTVIDKKVINLDIEWYPL